MIRLLYHVGSSIEHPLTSSSNQWSYGMSQSRNQSLSIHILLQQPWQMAIITPKPQIRIQLETICYTERIPIIPTDGIQSTRYPHHLSKDKCTWHSKRLLLLQEARKEADAAHELARQKMMERITRGFKPFKEGDKVWLESRYLKLRYESKKLAPKREGPFKVLEVLSPLNYRLELPKSWRIHPVIHITLLSPYKENNIHRTNYATPPPDLIEGEHEYEVEAIISHKKQGRGHAFLVKWKGFPTGDNTWEPGRNLNNAKRILKTYKERHELAWIQWPTRPPPLINCFNLF